MVINLIKKIVFSNRFLYETFFFLTRKKINRRNLDKKIQKLVEKENIASERINDLIVSLTSYGERLSDLKYTLFSLLQQKICPEKIIVWLSPGEHIPDELHNFERFGIEFKFYETNIKSYTKLIPALKQFPDKYIVTADDDIFYKKNWLRKIWKCHLKNPNSKICHIAHEVGFNKEKKVLPYRKWKHSVIGKQKNRKIFFPTGVGGVLYPPHLIPEIFLDEYLFMKLCPNADDVWFYFMGLLSNQETIIVPHPYNHLKYVDIYKECGLNGKSTLQSVNVEQNFNDIQIRNVMNHFDLSDEKLYNLIFQCKNY